MSSAPIPIPGRATTTSWRTSSTYTSSYFDDASTTEHPDNKSVSSSLTIYYPPRTNNKYIDSGYGTRNVSLEEKDDSSLSSSSTSGFQSAQETNNLKIKSTPLPGREDLQVFRKDIDALFTARYREIMPELHRLLQRQLSTQQAGALTSRRLFHSVRGAKSRTAATAVQMSLRLLTVGKTIQDAKPAIVVFTQGEQTSGLERLLRQPLMRQLCQPDDNITPSFEVILVGEPARKRRYHGDNISAVFDDASGRDSSTATYCGARILFEAGGGATIATLGGLVKLTFAVGDFMLVGMTAGHVLEDLYHDDESGTEAEAEDDNGDDDTNQEEHHTFFARPKKRMMGELLYPLTNPTEDGNALESPITELPPRDWALFEMNPSLKLKPNLIPRETDSGAYRGLHQPYHRGLELQSLPHKKDNCISAAGPESFPCVEPIEVVMIASNNSQSNPIYYGELSHIPASILLNSDPTGSGESMVEAYILTLDEKKDLTISCLEDTDTSTLGQIQDGHSGAWVVNPVSMEVYGHVVATDFTGDAYVIPLHAIFDEIKGMVAGVEEVSLPSMGDFVLTELRRNGTRTGTGARNTDRRRRSTRDTEDEDARRELVVGMGTVNGKGERSVTQQEGETGYAVEERGQREDSGNRHTADRDRRTSEILWLCGGGCWSRGQGREDNGGLDSDLDSGYGSGCGSVDTGNTSAMKVIFAVNSEKDEEKKMAVAGADISSCRPVPGWERRRRQSFWLDSEEPMCVSV